MKTYYGLNKDSVYNKYFYIYGYSLSINDHQKPEDKESAPYRFLADEEMIKVMDCIIDRSKSFNDIVAENSDISQTTA